MFSVIVVNHQRKDTVLFSWHMFIDRKISKLCYVYCKVYILETVLLDIFPPRILNFGSISFSSLLLVTVLPYPTYVLLFLISRLQTGMRGAFGKPQGTVARVRIGQPIMSVRTSDRHRAAVVEALRRAKFKFPGRQKVSGCWLLFKRPLFFFSKSHIRYTLAIQGVHLSLIGWQHQQQSLLPTIVHTLF